MIRFRWLALACLCLLPGCKVWGIWKPLEEPGVRLVKSSGSLISAETSQAGVQLHVTGFWSLDSTFEVEVANTRPHELRIGLPGTTLEGLHVFSFRRDSGRTLLGPGADAYAQRIAEAGSEEDYLASLPLTVGAGERARFLFSFWKSPRHRSEGELRLLLRNGDGPLRFSLRFLALRK